MQEGFLAEDDFGAQDDYQRELDEEAEFEQQRLDAERRNAAENVAGITLLQEGIQKLCLLHGNITVGQLHVHFKQHIVKAVVALYSHVQNMLLLIHQLCAEI